MTSSVEDSRPLRRNIKSDGGVRFACASVAPTMLFLSLLRERHICRSPTRFPEQLGKFQNSRSRRFRNRPRRSPFPEGSARRCPHQMPSLSKGAGLFSLPCAPSTHCLTPGAKAKTERLLPFCIRDDGCRINGDLSRLRAIACGDSWIVSESFTCGACNGEACEQPGVYTPLRAASRSLPTTHSPLSNAVSTPAFDVYGKTIIFIWGTTAASDTH